MEKTIAISASALHTILLWELDDAIMISGFQSKSNQTKVRKYLKNNEKQQKKDETKMYLDKRNWSNLNLSSQKWAQNYIKPWIFRAGSRASNLIFLKISIEKT